MVLGAIEDPTEGCNKFMKKDLFEVLVVPFLI